MTQSGLVNGLDAHLSELTRQAASAALQKAETYRLNRSRYGDLLLLGMASPVHLELSDHPKTTLPVRFRFLSCKRRMLYTKRKLGSLLVWG